MADQSQQSSAQKVQAIANKVNAQKPNAGVHIAALQQVKKGNLVYQEENAIPDPAQPNNEIETLISRAIDKNVPVETMEKLLAMRRELKAERAKEEYDRAMAAFQAECPTIKKTKIVYERDGRKERYRYAPLDSIVEQVKTPLAKHGFSYSTKTIQDEKMLGVTCRSTHRMGHSEETTFSVPIGSEAYMSDVQKYGARLTFAKRYAFCNAFGIMTGDDDTDAAADNQAQTRTPQVPPALITASQIKQLHTLLDVKGKEKEAIYNFYNVKSVKDLTWRQAAGAIKKLQSMDDAQPDTLGYPDENIDVDTADREIQKQMAEEAGA